MQRNCVLLPVLPSSITHLCDCVVVLWRWGWGGGGGGGGGRQTSWLIIYTLCPFFSDVEY